MNEALRLNDIQTVLEPIAGMKKVDWLKNPVLPGEAGGLRSFNVDLTRLGTKVSIEKDESRGLLDLWRKHQGLELPFRLAARVYEEIPLYPFEGSPVGSPDSAALTLESSFEHAT